MVYVISCTRLNIFFLVHGDFTLLLTDNETFVLYYGCLFESQDFWFVATPPDKSVNATNKERILVKIKELGFSREDQDVSDENDPIRFISGTINDCEGYKNGLP